MNQSKERRNEKHNADLRNKKKLINTFKHFMKTVFDSYRCPFKKVCDTTQLCLDGRLTCHNGENLDNQFPRTEPRISNWLQLKQSLISGKVQKVQILVFFTTCSVSYKFTNCKSPQRKLFPTPWSWSEKREKLHQDHFCQKV